MAEAIVGGEVYKVSFPNFKKLKLAWRYIEATQGAQANPLGAVDAILGIISVGSDRPVTVEALEEALVPAEMLGLPPFLNALMVEIGLVAGEAAPAGEGASPSTATSMPSSATSSPDSAQQIGTE